MTVILDELLELEERSEHNFYKRLPETVFNHPLWVNTEFDDKSAMIDLYYLAFDSYKGDYSYTHPRGQRMKKSSKRYKLIEKKIIKDKKSLEKSLTLVKETSTSKIDESIDLSIKINIKQSKGGDFNLRSVVKLPNGNGKKFKIAVLCEQEKVDEAKKLGADTAGSQELLDAISNGKLNFDKLICTPGMMSKIGKLGKILGPKGLMPNPKLGTVSNDLKKSITDLKTGLVEIKNDKDGNVALSIGRKSFKKEKLEENYKFFMEFLKKEKPENIKGEFIKNIFLTSTMGISYKIGKN